VTWWAWLLVASFALLVVAFAFLLEAAYGAKHHWAIAHTPTRAEKRRSYRLNR
jgi:hypothetical protein